MKPAVVVALLFRTLDVLRIFDLPYIMTGGGAGDGNDTTTLSILVVNEIRSGFNSAAALSTLTFLFIFLVAFLFIKVLGADLSQDEEGSADMATTTTDTPATGATPSGSDKGAAKQADGAVAEDAAHVRRRGGHRDLGARAVLLDGGHRVPRPAVHLRHHPVADPRHVGQLRDRVLDQPAATTSGRPWSTASSSAD